jgi:hypothetical protein
MDNSSPSMLKATLIGGATAGFVGAIPFVNWLNCACCALVVAGGFFAAYLYSNECKSQGSEFTSGSGAIVGLVAGMFYALTNVIVGGIISSLMGQSVEKFIDQIEAQGQELPPEAEPVIDFLLNTSSFVLIVMWFFVILLIAAIFSTIGGLIGGAVFKVQAPPPAPPAQGTTS